jgi:hypothetical protein
MANTLRGRMWSVDIAGAGAVTTSPVKVKSVKWISAAAVAGQGARITDPVNGGVLFEEIATGGNFVAESLLETWWINGFIVDTLASGRLSIEVC